MVRSCNSPANPVSVFDTALARMLYFFVAACHYTTTQGPETGQRSIHGGSVIPDKELKILESFNGRGHVVLSAYLPLDTPEHRQSAHESFLQLAQKRLEECGHRADCREAISEDIEIVGLYLKSNGQRPNLGLAIFSCAAELFWRAYPLPVPVSTQVSVGSRFDLEPLKQVVERIQRP